MLSLLLLLLLSLLLLLLLLSQPLQWLQVHRHRHNIIVASAASCDPEKDHDEKHHVNSCITKASPNISQDNDFNVCCIQTWQTNSKNICRHGVFSFEESTRSSSRTTIFNKQYQKL